MLRRHPCVSVHCDQCTDTPAGARFDAHYPSESAALGAAWAAGWVRGPDGQLWCSACGPILACEAEGHDFGPWQQLPGPTPDVVSEREYRNCQRCCLHESRTTPTGLGQVA